MTAEDNKLDECLNEIFCMVVGVILIHRLLYGDTDKHKDQKPRRKPKGRWRYKQYEEWDKK